MMPHQLLKNYQTSWMSKMNSMDEDSSFEVLETPMETKEPEENLGTHSDRKVKNLKDQVDQFPVQGQALDFPENPEEVAKVLQGVQTKSKDKKRKVWAKAITN